MYTYIWEQGTLRRLVLAKSSVIFKNGVLKKMGLGHPVKMSTPTCMLY